MLRTWIFQPASFIDGWHGDGLIAMIPDEEMEASVRAIGRPVVCVSTLMPTHYPVSVRVDDRAVGQMAARHFLDRGFRNFAFVGHSDMHPLSAFVVDRLQGYVQEIEAAGFTVQSITHINDLEDLLRSLTLPAAVFAANDEYGTRTITAAERLGLRVPEQLAVLGVDNDDLLVESTTVALSSIELPTYKIGFEAAALLDELMRGNTPPRTEILLPPVGVVTRKSTDITAIPDHDLSSALAFIREHIAEPIGVEDVVAAVPLSRRVLERRFRKYLGRSALEEIHRARIERARTLLITTDLSIEEVARACGFTGRSRFHATFTAMTGKTPTDFRRIYQNGKTGGRG